MRRNNTVFAKGLIAVALCFSMMSCSPTEAVRAGRIIASGDVQSAGVWAAEKSTRYALNPKQLENDLKQFQARLDAFRDAVKGVWGDKEVEEPAPKKYVKYTQNYLSRAMVDFDSGVITVETVDTENPNQSLHNAIVTTLLTPYDPRGLDLWSAGEVKLEGDPFLLGEVRDFENQVVRYPWRAERFATQLVNRHKQVRAVPAEGKPRMVHYVTIDMVPDHLHVRAVKYRPEVIRWSRHYKVSTNLVFAIIKTESDFNPWAVSHVPAYGLMQIVPKTAGADVYEFLHGKKGYPSGDFLYRPENNIQYGTAYLNILDNRYLAAIRNPVSREYCTIAAYNGGAGNVLRTFHSDRNKAPDVINGMTPAQVYDKLYRYLPYMETRRYLWKVVQARKEFVSLQ